MPQSHQYYVACYQPNVSVNISEFSNNDFSIFRLLTDANN